MGKLCKGPCSGAAQLGAVILFSAISVLLLIAMACTPSSKLSAHTPLPSTALAATPQPTPISSPDIEREAIMSFTVQTLEIETKRNDLIAYFAGLSEDVGTYGKDLALEKFFSIGVPATLKGAPPSGLDGMATLRNTLVLLDSPQSTNVIKEALIDIYAFEIQLALNQLVYPEITIDNLGYIRQLVSDGGPSESLNRFRIGTDWFGVQELRGQTYIHWAAILQQYDIDSEGVRVAIQDTPEADFRQRLSKVGEAPNVTYFKVLGLETAYSRSRDSYIDLIEKLRDVFRMQQRVGLFTESGIDPEPDWATYVRQHRGGGARENAEEGERILRSILGMTHEQRERAGLTFEPGTPGNIEELQEYLKAGTRLRSGPSGSDLIASRVPYMLQTWMLDRPQTTDGAQMPFLDFLTLRFGLFFDN